jgi:alpha-tubulin suppressor-like RCC1 family protein
LARKRNLLLIGVAAAALFGAQGTSAAADAPKRAPLDATQDSPRPLSMLEARQLGLQTGARQQPQGRSAAEAKAAAAVGSGGSVYTSLSPVRILDTRSTAPIPGGQTRQLPLPAQVPAGATAVVLNVTGVSPTASTFVTVWPAGADRPGVSNVNLRAGEIRANAATVALDASRALNFYNNTGNTHVVADLAGYYAPATGSRFTAQAPVRVLDTRSSGGALGTGGTRIINLSARVPATATAVTFNLTGASATAGTFVTAWPTGAARPTASTLNLVPGQVTPNQVTVALGTNRSVTLYNNSGNTHLIADLAGYYATDRGNPFYQLAPVRVLDTRGSEPLPGGFYGTIDLSPELPASAAAVTFNLTGTGPTASTYLTAYPTGQSVPTASNLNLAPGQTAANLVTVALGAGRQVNVYNFAGNVDFLMDVAGYFAPAPAACASGCVQSWGQNVDAQLGVGTTGGSSNEPGRIDGISGVTSVTGGLFTGYALRNDGSVLGWGYNGLAGLGNGQDYGTSTVPVTVNSLSGITQIASGGYSAYALDNLKQVWAWGYNGDGSLGDGSVATRLNRVRVSIPADVTQVAAGFTTGYALRANGTVWAWGANGGALGNGAYGTGCDTVPVGPGCRAVTPTQVPGLTGVVSIGATYNAAFAVKADGTVWAWGWNAEAELGLGTAGGPACYANTSAANCAGLSPVQIPGLTGVAKIVSGSSSTTYAVKTDGTVLSWGWNADGELGNGTAGGVCADPGQTNCVGFTPAAVSGLTGVTNAVAGISHALALKSDGSVWSWGSDTFGQLGQHPEVLVPGQVAGLSGVTVVGSGGATSYAVS